MKKLFKYFSIIYRINEEIGRTRKVLARIEAKAEIRLQRLDRLTDQYEEIMRKMEKTQKVVDIQQNMMRQNNDDIQRMITLAEKLQMYADTNHQDLSVISGFVERQFKLLKHDD